MPSPKVLAAGAGELIGPARRLRLPRKDPSRQAALNKLAISINHPETSPMICPFQYWPGGIDRDQSGRIEIAVVRIEMPLANQWRNRYVQLN